MISAVVIDIDDTIIDTSQRMQSIWRHVLETNVRLKDVEVLNLEQIFNKHASTKQKSQAPELRSKFFALLLCENETGIRLAQQDRAIPHSAEILKKWAKKFEIIYLTGRPEHTRNLTLKTLEKFGFPTDDIIMLMVTLQDWKNRNQTKKRHELLTSTTKQHQVESIIDDYPGYFPIYQELKIPERIGLLNKKYQIKDYLEKGATRVINDWKELK